MNKIGDTVKFIEIANQLIIVQVDKMIDALKDNSGAMSKLTVTIEELIQSSNLQNSQLGKENNDG